MDFFYLGKLMNLVTVFTAVLQGFAHEICESCDCLLSDLPNSEHGVRSVKTICDEGKIEWYSPYGALSIELKYSRSGGYRACFMIESVSTELQVSEESWNNSEFPLSRRLPPAASLKPLVSINGNHKEFCVTSLTPVILYLEPVRTQEMSGLSHVKFQYLLESRNFKAELDPIEECRPCSKAELIMAYCSSDFVIEGRMANVTHKEEESKSYVGVHVSRVIRQRDSTLFYRPHRDSKELYGHMVIPRHCGAKKSKGTFLLAGKVRFGEPTKSCSLYLDDWERIAANAVKDGDMLCTLK
ncbi:hypothetical protein FSP39_011837 [Pinctada imbricata]|uniref:Meteorin-like protein n=1 Tax=Pinctada imbricata TaxID=66713 RepID=A0AA89C3D5_PINIB|nr:hypothetical protein FSP39_011837 [Pinctada imbricata]